MIVDRSPISSSCSTEVRLPATHNLKFEFSIVFFPQLAKGFSRCGEEGTFHTEIKTRKKEQGNQTSEATRLTPLVGNSFP